MIKLYNTMSRKAEEFEPIKPGEVSIYSCGPTVYHYAHLGNHRTNINNDVLRRMFRAHGFEVKSTMNITDVGHLVSDEDTGEDKMQKGARREGKTAWDVAEFYTAAFLRDMKDLNILAPTFMPRATDYIMQQIAWVKKLEELGYTYRIEGDGIYYDTSKFPDYGKLGHQNLDELRGGARVSDAGKKNPADFALWKFSPLDAKRDMEWDSPWGKGFPGWHIECSVMSAETLGKHFDIHTGGVDHIKVHHTNEIAQSEPVVGAPWVNYWMHFEFLNDKTGKMSKSKGNFLIVDSLKAKGFEPIAYRYLVLMGHYQSQMEFSWEALDAAQNGYNNLIKKISMLKPSGEAKADEYKNKLLNIISNNLDTANVLVAVQELLKSNESDATKFEAIRFADELLGLRIIENAKKSVVAITPEIQALLDARAAARADKDWARSDKLRDELAAMGFAVNDQKL
ncbi:MAG: cysteine--tRNA ligase [Rickettsiales bacterium]|jgi:cysteinyl-tRNA synthetase|nr:cysteine--tRNA ligase [Rickettsiales bacterium]